MKLLKKILLFKLAFIITLVFCEIFIRFSYISTIGMTEFDEKFGRIRNKNSRFVHFNEGFGIFDVNQFGYLESGGYKDSLLSDISIAFLGDSYVESFQVFTRHHFLNKIEKRLEENQLKVKTMNFGRSGFDFLDMYAYQKEFVSTFNPENFPASEVRKPASSTGQSTGRLYFLPVLKSLHLN